jgi:hypothetical protein
MAIRRSAAIAAFGAVLAASLSAAVASSAAAATATTTQAARPAAAPAAVAPGKLIELPYPGVVFTTGNPHTWSSTTVHLSWQSDGNLVLYCNANTGHPNMVLWALPFTPSPNAVVDFGGGPLSLAGGIAADLGPGGIYVAVPQDFGQAPEVRWNPVAGQSGDYAVVQNDGNFVIYNPSGKAIWATGSENVC